MWSKNGPITSQVIKIIHDNSYKEVDDLKQEQGIFFSFICMQDCEKSSLC